VNNPPGWPRISETARTLTSSELPVRSQQSCTRFDNVARVERHSIEKLPRAPPHAAAARNGTLSSGKPPCPSPQQEGGPLNPKPR
jgi:hypothetical protein